MTIDTRAVPLSRFFIGAAFWLLRELVWWRVVGTLGGLLIAFVASTGAARWALGPRAPARLAP